MKTSFKVERLHFQTIRELPDSWAQQDYLNLLEIMDYENAAELPAQELKEMCLMSLTDNEPEDAANIVLEYVFKDKLTVGQRENLSNEMLDERMWEEYADLSMHESFFNVHQLLFEAFNGRFPRPEAVNFQLRVTAKEKKAFSIFDYLPEATLIRLLVAGMHQNTLIYRLFEEQVEGDEFKDSKDIIWQLKRVSVDETEIVFDVISSDYWFHDFKYVKNFEANTHGDVISRPL